MPYEMLKNNNSPYHDLPQNNYFTNTPLDDCKAKCDQNTDCAGFAYDTRNNNNLCWLKDNTMYPKGDKVPLDGVDIYWKSNKHSINHNDNHITMNLSEDKELFSGVLTKENIPSVNSYMEAIQTNLQSQSDYINNISKKHNVILDKQEIQLNQLKEIQDKEKLLLTHYQMLKIAKERNSYKKKLIYTLLAINFGLFILIIFIYVSFTRKMSITL
jgi:hypothetical protein